MKKLIVLCAVVLATCTLASGQDKKPVQENRMLIAISAGPAFPVGDFAAKDVATNTEAGLAKTGINMNLQFRYRIQAMFGLGVSAGYAKHNLDVSSLQGMQADHWQYYSFLAGPYISTRVTDKISFDLKSLIGVASVNAPKFSYNESILWDEQWKTTFALQVGGNLRFNFSRNWCLLTSLDYNYMKPTLDIPDDGSGTTTASQKMSNVTLNAGIGYRF